MVSIPSPGCCEKYDGVLGVRSDEFFDGRPLLESVERVLEELYDDRWSADTADCGVREGFGVKGARFVDVASEGGGELVSRVKDDPLTSFFDDEFPSLRNAFQLGVLGELGPGDDGLNGGECSLCPKRLW